MSSSPSGTSLPWRRTRGLAEHVALVNVSVFLVLEFVMAEPFLLAGGITLGVENRAPVRRLAPFLDRS